MTKFQNYFSIFIKTKTLVEKLFGRKLVILKNNNLRITFN